MSLKSVAAKILAKRVVRSIEQWAKTPVKTQQKVFESLIEQAKNTQFGQDHDFGSIKTHSDFVNAVPVRDYEGLRFYVDLVVQGEEDILWPGKPLYFAKTSGTTSGVKYIPLTKESMPFHIQAARNAILCYIAQTGKVNFVDGKMIFLQGSPEVKTINGIGLGRLSGIVAHYVPSYLQKNRLPSLETNCIADWDTKVEAIVDETIDQDMRVISGIPSWVQMYFERLQLRSGKPIGELFPNFDLFIYGGVNFEPYRARFDALIGRKVDSIELYPASEGFFAFQDDQQQEGMLLLLNSGIFYEFVAADNFFDEQYERLTIGQVQKGVNYVMIISTNAGLWSYNLGDTVSFVSLDPYRVVVTGRVKHFISAFGEHVIGKEVEQAMKEACELMGIVITEFTVAPQANPPEGNLPYHEWLIEFDSPPENLKDLESLLDSSMQAQNTYYFDLIDGKILQPLKISSLAKDSFNNYMKSKGKLGGQNKIPRLGNDRIIADALLGMQS